MHEQHTTSTLTGPAAALGTPPEQSATAADPRPAFARALHTAVTVADAVARDRLDDPTPCDGMDVRELLRHLHMAVARAGAVTATAAPDAPPLPVEDPSIADDGFTAAIAEAGAEATAAWADDSLLTTVLTLPWMQAEGAHVLAIYVNEVIVHTWDLATATGQSPTWDEADVDVALAAIRRELPDADRAAMWEAVRSSLPPEVLAARPWSDPFADAVEVPATATPVERLVAWQGRRP